MDAADTEENDSVDSSVVNQFVKRKGKTKKQKVGRKGQWSMSATDDLVDIIVNDEYSKNKQIFQNTKTQQNSVIYEKVLKELKRSCDVRGEDIQFTVAQAGIKFKKCVSDCKKAALTIKTATGIKRFQDQKGYGAWFSQLFALIKTRDSCQPERAIEPSADSATSSEGQTSTESEENVPVPSTRSNKRNKKKDNNSEAMSQMVEIMKEMVEKDPMKDFLQLLKDEMKANRELEMRLYELMFNTIQPNNLRQGSSSMQQNYNYAEPNFNSGYLNAVNDMNFISAPQFQQTSTPNHASGGTSSSSETGGFPGYKSNF